MMSTPPCSALRSPAVGIWNAIGDLNWTSACWLWNLGNTLFSPNNVREITRRSRYDSAAVCSPFSPLRLARCREINTFLCVMSAEFTSTYLPARINQTWTGSAAASWAVIGRGRESCPLIGWFGFVLHRCPSEEVEVGFGGWSEVNKTVTLWEFFKKPSPVWINKRCLYSRSSS